MFFLLLLSLPSWANSGVRPYYETRELQREMTERPPLRKLVKKTNRYLKSRDIQQVILSETPDSGSIVLPPKIKFQGSGSLPYHVLYAAYLPLHLNLPGAELDLLVPNQAGEHIPITAFWDSSQQTIDLQIGRSLVPGDQVLHSLPASDETTPTVDFVDQRSQWEVQDRNLVYQALAMLPQPVLERIQGVPLYRESKATGDLTARVLGQKTAFTVVHAAYISDINGTKINLYDSALRPSTRFAGEPDSPKPASVMTLLHEIGHAFAYFEQRQRMEKYFTIQRQHEALRTRFNNLLNTQPSNPCIEDIAKEASECNRNAEKESLKKQLSELTEKMSALTKESRFSNSPSKPAQALLEVLGNTFQAPTVYGSYGPEETFAECFALYHVDPKALKRASPRAYQWFQSSKHLLLDTVP